MFAQSYYLPHSDVTWILQWCPDVPGVMGPHARLAVESERDALANRPVLVGTYYDQLPILSNNFLLQKHRLFSVMSSSVCVGIGEDVHPWIFPALH